MASARHAPVAWAVDTWREKAQRHQARMEAWLRPHLERRSHNRPDPVADFLFDYYSFRPSLLARWTPGVERWLAQGEAYADRPHFATGPLGVGLPASGVPARRREEFRAIRNLLEATRQRKPFLGCLGLHEWAMVHDERDVRHASLPLRLGHAATRRLAESLPIRCSHFDAFRHFSLTARMLNLMQPTAGTRSEHEQPGCLHANMDLYKHAYKLYPWVEGELLADAFELARRAREIDMRASPYDVSGLGLNPITIETSAGQAEYRDAQRLVAEQAAPLRDRLVEEIDRLLALTEGAGGGQGDRSQDESP